MTTIAPAKILPQFNDVDRDSPMVAHYEGAPGTLKALCGARVLGIPAPFDAPCCEKCMYLRHWRRP